MVKTTRMTTAQAIVKFLDHQYVSMDGVETKFVEGFFTIFGHGIAVGLGEALDSNPDDLKLTLRELENQEYYTIRISGTKAAVDAVNAEDVIGVIDMNALLEKLGLTEWVPGIYQGEITFNDVLDDVTLEQPYQMTIVLEAIEEEADGNNNE